MFGVGVMAAVSFALATPETPVGPAHAVHCPAAEPANASLPTWSPASDRLAFAVPSQETGAIAVAKPGAARPSSGWLSFDSAPAKLVWDPVGEAIAFEKRTGAIEVLILGKFGGSREVVHAEFGKLTELGNWSPDGQSLVFARDGHIYILEAFIGETRHLVDGVHPRWSPDGREIAFVADEFSGRSATPVDLDVIQPDGSGHRTLVGGLPSISSIAWSPDSSQVAFLGKVIGLVARAGGAVEYTEPAEPPLEWRKSGIFYNLTQVAPLRSTPMRFDPETDLTVQLTHLRWPYDARFAASSPNGTLVAYDLDTNGVHAGVRVVDSQGEHDQPLLACRGTNAPDRISGSRLNDIVRTNGGGKDRVSCGSGRDIVYADRSDVVAPDCERVIRLGVRPRRRH